MIDLHIIMEPVSKGRPRFSSKAGRTFTPTKTICAETAIQAAWQAAGRPRLPGVPLALDVTFWFERSAGHYLKDGSLSAAGRRAIPGGNRDWDNLAKTLSDALNRLAWPDDRFICEAYVAKRWAERGDPPSISVRARCCP